MDDLIDWYRSLARPFLERVEPGRVPALDAECGRLARARGSQAGEFAVCFIGSSGVGKSTLINALVAGANIILPSGGLGPLTAQALTVRYGPAPSFEAEYHRASRLWRLLFSLESSHKAELQARRPDAALTKEEAISNGLDADEAQDIIQETTDAENAGRGKAAEFRRIAQLMVAGADGDRDTPYLTDRIREVLGKEPVWGTQLRTEDEQRLRRLQRALQRAQQRQPYELSGSLDDSTFLLELKFHAAGFLAPLISQLRVLWPSDLLREGIALVDLPGVGIAGDPYRHITHEWIRNQARAVVLVVDHRGVTEADADLLRSSGFLNRLLYAADDPTADPVLLVVAVVKLDDIANTRYAEDRQRRKIEHFTRVRDESVPLVTAQLRQQLEQVWSASDDAVRGTQKEIIDHILQSVRVHPLSAIEYRRHLAADEDDPAFIRHERDSGVPDLRATITDLARTLLAERAQRLAIARDLFCSQIETALRLIEAQWQDPGRAAQEAERLRAELSDFLAPLETEFHGRQGAFREFLRKTMPARIEAVVKDARQKATTEIFRYLGKLQDAHWATLRAAVRRGGTFFGARHIELPKDFALRFEEPVAEAWGKTILHEIRQRTREYGEDCTALVEQLMGWAEGQGARIRPELVAAQREAIHAQVAGLTSVGREMVNELRETVKSSLIRAIEDPIQKRCRHFVERNEHIGVGVKRRILDLFQELAEQTTQVASQPASDILTKCFRDVEKEIREAFDQHPAPLRAAADALVASHETLVKRSDAQRRRRVLEELQAVAGKSPCRDAVDGAAGSVVSR